MYKDLLIVVNFFYYPLLIITIIIGIFLFMIMSAGHEASRSDWYDSFYYTLILTVILKIFKIKIKTKLKKLE